MSSTSGPGMTAAEFRARLQQIGEERYHHRHPFHLLMHEGKLSRGQLQATDTGSQRTPMGAPADVSGSKHCSGRMSFQTSCSGNCRSIRNTLLSSVRIARTARVL